MRRLTLLAVCTGSLLPGFSEARPPVEVEFMGGAPASVRSRFELSQDGFDEIGFTASYRTRPLTFPIYYAVRVGVVVGPATWSAELLHHKIYLRNPPPEIESFAVSHGFNLLTVQRTWVIDALRLHAGAGTVIAHPESRIRGLRFDESSGLFGSGYHFAGPALTSGVGRRFELRDDNRLFAILEGRVTWAPVTVPVADGEASFTSTAFHAMFGLGGTL